MQEVRDNILPLSVAATVPAAFAEWAFTDSAADRKSPTGKCDLCGRQDFRYFEIANRYTDATLWVGSHCIRQFDLSVLERGRCLSPDHARRHLAKLTQQMQHESCIRALEQLATKDSTPMLSRGLAYYVRNKKLTPTYAAVVFWKLQLLRIGHRPSFFQIELRRAQHLEDLRQMPTRRVHRFWGALTSAQRRKALELGHPPPCP